MNTNSKIVLSVMTGAALGAAAMQGLQAQDKLKAYSVAEVETLDAGAQAAYLLAFRRQIEAADGHPLLALGGRVVRMSSSGIASAPRLTSINRKPGRIPDGSVTGLKKRYGATSSKWKSNNNLPASVLRTH